jgi:hypothetical protein
MHLFVFYKDICLCMYVYISGLKFLYRQDFEMWMNKDTWAGKHT